MNRHLLALSLCALLAACGDSGSAGGSDAAPPDDTAAQGGRDAETTASRDAGDDAAASDSGDKGGASDAGADAGNSADADVAGDAFSGAAGKGIFGHVVAGSGDKERHKDKWEFWARDTAVAGTQLSYS